MSTTFEVFPANTHRITFGEVLELANQTIHTFFQAHSIEGKVSLQAEVLSAEASSPAAASQEFRWLEEEYAWVSVSGFLGGTDIYCDSIADQFSTDEKWWRLDEVLEAPNFSPEHENLINRTKQLDHKWVFRRSAGQPAIINLCYAHLAAATANLSGGLIFSGDQAWEYDLFPCSSQRFLERYLNPKSTNSTTLSEWATYNIESIRKSFENGL